MDHSIEATLPSATIEARAMTTNINPHEGETGDVAGQPGGEVAVPPADVRHHDHPLPKQQAPDDIFAQAKTFADLGLRNSVLKGVEATGFVHPTYIQEAMIPAVIAGRDVIGQAKTGTGKTAAFGLPLFHRATRGLAFQSLILAPTRELAIQISQDLKELGQFTPIQVAPIYGGQAIHTQASKLQREPEIIVGTPGRVMDMIERGLLHLNNVKFAVLDEVDRMLDIGFREDIKKILGKCPKERQTVFVSATISPEIERLARSYMIDPEKILVAAGSLTVSRVEQHYLAVQPWDKKRLLKHLLTHEEPALTVVFCKLKRVCDELARYLSDKGIDAHAIHADLSQGRRNAVMQKLRAGELGVLIASDLASRGIDVDGITHVINYDLPEDPEVYVHRIGRTARAGRRGIAWSLVTPEQGELLSKVENLINLEIPKLDYPDFQPGEAPQGFDDSRRRREDRAKRQAEIDASGKPVLSARLQNTGPSLPPATKADPSKFPGGVVPTKLPPRLLMGKVKGGRR
jgi:ATP-dependent RNA helicase DeaD